MNSRKKNAIYSVFLAIALYGGYQYQQSVVRQQQDQHPTLAGNTMGTTYHIRYQDAQGRNLQEGVDSLLVAFNQSLSTYIPTSEISEFNDSHALRYRSPYFFPVLQKSKEVFELTDGAFDPTVMPLVKAWGFGPGEREYPDSARVDSLRSLVGFTQIEFDNTSVRKAKEEVMLDFSAIAKGYGVDVVGEYLEERGIQDYMVEIGGEVRCRGENAEGQSWRIGIKNPEYKTQSDERPTAILNLQDRSMATSGNYENYYIKDGRRYAHTIDPKTGYPVEHTLLSASVVATDCMTADAFATAFMVLGKDKAIQLAQRMEDLEVLLIYSDEAGELRTFQTQGMAALMQPSSPQP
ncbi:thiamine biosynthesis lipoprotein [Catalinimonas alkaloidigena]|uniref:FAD:protein FMN transferase n=1 Tax=Catalinimonas alkaloidigena TaxID=1075417 RepID=A0A1G9E192_9BACT|nr:FAD:protein FMN transferase [Catalinimonas alkaloidigena]SDK69893.1 thiamine biosynthesis lipoprotein [Catalinimonas alkaloidigena]